MHAAVPASSRCSCLFEREAGQVIVLKKNKRVDRGEGPRLKQPRYCLWKKRPETPVLPCSSAHTLEPQTRSVWSWYLVSGGTPGRLSTLGGYKHFLDAFAGRGSRLIHGLRLTLSCAAAATTTTGSRDTDVRFGRQQVGKGEAFYNWSCSCWA